MKNIIIIGNGFDLAHGLKTSYTDFLHYCLSDTQVRGLFCEHFYYTIPKDKTEFLKQLKQFNFNFKSNLFKHFYTECLNKNWCDVEELYFSLIKETKNSNSIININAEFQVFKDVLYKYIKDTTKEKHIVKNYQTFFNQFDIENTLIVNFNYTDTVKQYLKSSENLINIHGQIDDKDNLPIFGYSLTTEKFKTYNLEKSDTEYKRFVKNRDYIITDSHNRIRTELEELKTGNINVYILGHSCGLSDQKILYDIFTHTQIKNVMHLKYGNDDSFKVIFDNINKIIGGVFEKITNARKSLYMPQKDEDKIVQKHFEDNIKTIQPLKYERPLTITELGGLFQ